MKKNIVKTMLKAAATTAMVAAMFVGGNKMEAKAGEVLSIEEFAAMKGVTVEAVGNSDELLDEYGRLALGEESYNYVVATISNDWKNGTFQATVTNRHEDMLDLVNADRANYGAGNLAWNADLEAIANQRAWEVMCNAQTAAYVSALNTGDYETQCALIHSGMREGTSENAIVSYYTGVTSVTANANWIASEGHHVERINAGYTQYAAASYTDPLTGMETWVEVFADNNFKGVSTFDSARYAADYPDLAAAFGNDKNALYNHYITSGRKEGRKAYNTDGTTFK